MTKREVIENLELHPLEIEGGFFREVYRSRTPVEITAPDGEKGRARSHDRPAPCGRRQTRPTTCRKAAFWQAASHPVGTAVKTK